MKKNFSLLLILSLILTACSNTNDTVSETDSKSQNNSTMEDSTANEKETDAISGSFGTQFDNGSETQKEDEYDQELLDLGFKGPEFYLELLNEANNSFVYTGLNIANRDLGIENIIFNDGMLTYNGRFAVLVSSYLESHHSYTDTDSLYPSYAITINDIFFGTRESIDYFEKRYPIFKKGNKFKNEQILEINMYTSKDRVKFETYLKQFTSDVSDQSPSVLLPNMFYREEIIVRELYGTKNEKIITTYLIDGYDSKTKYLCGLQSPALIPLSNLPEVATEAYTQFYNSKKNDSMLMFILPDYSNLESQIRAYILPGLACFEVLSK